MVRTGLDKWVTGTELVMLNHREGDGIGQGANTPEKDDSFHHLPVVNPVERMSGPQRFGNDVMILGGYGNYL